MRPCKNLYIYPYSNRNHSLVHNPYIDDFIASGSRHFNIVNANARSNTGFFDFARYIFKTDVLCLNWVEDIPDHRFGRLQVVFYFMAMAVCKFRGVKVIWTMHNKASHHKKNRWLKNYMLRHIKKRAQMVLTHAREGIELIENQRGQKNKKTLFFPHPFKNKLPTQPEISGSKKYDFLVWGTIAPYKNIDGFLDFMIGQQLNQKFSVYIQGKVPDGEYKQKILSYNSFENINITDRYIEQEEMKTLIGNSRFVLFPYKPDSVLSSGALMDTLVYPVPVIGPNTGAFADMGQEGIIYTYQSYKDIFEIAGSHDDEKFHAMMSLKKGFIQASSWDKYLDFINKAVNEPDIIWTKT